MNYVVRNGRFIYSGINAFAPEYTKAFFEDRCVHFKTERGNRVYPVSDNANDIADALEKYAVAKGVKIIKAKVDKIIAKDNVIGGVVCKGVEYTSKSVCIATGGASYKATGSTGDGLWVGERIGHTIVELKPSLLALSSTDDC